MTDNDIYNNPDKYSQEIKEAANKVLNLILNDEKMSEMRYSEIKHIFAQYRK